MEELKPWSDEDIKELEKLSRPIAKLLQKKRDNQESVIITVDRCEVVSLDVHIPFNLPQDY